MVLFSAGCFGNKNPDVADAPPPPPAAYPDTSGGVGGAGSATPPPQTAPSSATMAATNQRPAIPQAPVPFSLRQGEQLVPHVIQSGENLSSIAAKYNTTVGRIQSANGMTDTRIFAGKSLQVPTSAPPTNLAQGAPMAQAPSAGLYGASSPSPGSPTFGATAGGYPGTMAPPTVPVAPTVPTTPAVPSYPAASASEGAIAAPPVPPGGGTATPPGYPSSTSYPRSAPAPAAPSFQGSRVQFSN